MFLFSPLLLYYSIRFSLRLTYCTFAEKDKTFPVIDCKIIIKILKKKDKNNSLKDPSTDEAFWKMDQNNLEKLMYIFIVCHRV